MSAVAPHPPSPLRVFLPVALGTALSLMGDSAIYVVLPTHTAVVGVALTAVGILLSINRFVRLGANGLAGWLCDRGLRRRLFVASLFTAVVATALFGLGYGFWPVLAGRILWGIAWSGIWVSGNAIMLDITAGHNRGRWIGYYHISFFLGASLGSLMGGLLTDWLGYRPAMGVAVVVTLFGALIAFIFLPKQPGRTLATAPAAEPRHHPAPVVDDRPRGLAHTAELVSATLLLGVNRFVVAGVLASTLSLFLSEQVGESVSFGALSIGVATLTGLGLGVNTLVSMVSTPVAGGLSDRFGNRWSVAAWGLIPGIAGFGLIASGNPVAVLLGLALTATTNGSGHSLSTSLLGDLSRHHERGRSLGLLYTIGDLGSALAPPLAYGMIPVWGIYSVYWLSLGLLAVMLLIAAGWAVRQALGTVPAVEQEGRI